MDADLSTADGVANLVRQVPKVDILVNNLGIFEPKPFEEIPDSWFCPVCGARKRDFVPYED